MEGVCGIDTKSSCFGQVIKLNPALHLSIVKLAAELLILEPSLFRQVMLV